MDKSLDKILIRWILIAVLTIGQIGSGRLRFSLVPVGGNLWVPGHAQWSRGAGRGPGQCLGSSKNRN